MESFRFFLNPFTTDVLVRSEEEPGPEPGRFRFVWLDLSSASSRTLMSLAFFKASDTSASMRERSSFTALALWSVLLFSWEPRKFSWRRSSSFNSAFTGSTSSKNFSRFTPPSTAAISTTWWWWWSGEAWSPLRVKEPENKSFILRFWCMEEEKWKEL